MWPALAALGRGAGAATKGLGTGAAASGNAGGLYPPLERWMQQTANKSWPNAAPSPSELVGLLRFGGLDQSVFLEKMHEWGFDSDWSLKLFESSQALLSAGDYVSLLRRKEIDESTFADKMKKLGFKSDEIKNVLKATEYFPPPDDLIRFAVRDVYTEATVSTFGLFDALPSKFVEEAAKSGLSAEFAKLYWGAHWQLPSLTMGYEMFHRNIIDGETLKLLMQTQDVMPFWRDKLLQLSYNPLTRVDVRRMFDAGVLDESGVNRAYLDIGYSPENAKALTDFTKKITSDESKGLTKDAVLRSYKDGLIDVAETTRLLKQLGLEQQTISFYLAMAEHEQQTQELDALVKELTAKWTLGLVDENAIRAQLSAHDAPASYIEQVVTRIQANQASRIKLPSRTDLERWFERDLISEEYYFESMVKLGYRREDARLYMAEIVNKRDHPERKFLGIAVYQRWLKSGILTPQEFEAIGLEMKLDSADIQRSITESQNAAS